MAKKKKAEVKKKSYEVLVRPLVTEKTSLVSEMGSVVAFEVAPKASKGDIREAVQSIFDVEVLGVNTINCRGKLRRRGRQVGMTRSYKKAYVTLGPGQAIDVVEGL
ncbi:MAG: 50S ribosomal protein L23 [Bdellovibrionales bacterium]|nr:50S ribosomal protein L23 [Bdellovibrionales bacterium]